MTDGQHPVEMLMNEVNQANAHVVNVGTLLTEAWLKGEITVKVEEHPEFLAATNERAEAEERLSLAINPRLIFET